MPTTKNFDLSRTSGTSQRPSPLMSAVHIFALSTVFWTVSGSFWLHTAAIAPKGWSELSSDVHVPCSYFVMGAATPFAMASNPAGWRSRTFFSCSNSERETDNLETLNPVTSWCGHISHWKALGDLLMGDEIRFES